MKGLFYYPPFYFFILSVTWLSLLASTAVVASSLRATATTTTITAGAPPQTPLLSTASSAQPLLPWGDVNLLIVTDVHSWIGGHARHQEHSLWNERIELDVDYGDVVSFYQQLKQYATSSSSSPKNLFFVMNGDFTDGTGLTTFPPTQLCQLLENMPWDAINIGNHELYLNATVEALYDFIDFWKGRYLTSNVLSSTTREPLGQRFLFLRGPTATVLTFGFLYNMMGNCAAAIVEPVQEVVRQAWFRQVLTGGGGGTTSGSFDAILVLAHMDYLDPLVTDVLLPAIRQHVGNSMPIQFVTGHSHIRGFAQLDPYSTSLEAGRYLDTLGFVSFPVHSTVLQEQQQQQQQPSTKTPPLPPTTTTTTVTSSKRNGVFQHVMIDANRETFRSILNVSTFETPDGKAYSDRIHQTQKDLGLLQPLGCSPDTYYVESGLDDNQSLWRVYVQQVLPLMLLDAIRQGQTNLLASTNSSNDNATILPIMVQGTGAFRYDLFEGRVVLDDIIAVCPFRDVIYQIIPSIRGDVLSRILTLASATRPRFSEPLPPYVIAGEMPLVDEQVYQLLTVDFDVKFWTQRILNLNGISVTPVPIVNVNDNQEVTTTQLWIDFVQTQWSNASCPMFGAIVNNSNSNTRASDGEIHDVQNMSKLGDGVDNYDELFIYLYWLETVLFVLIVLGLLLIVYRKIMCLADGVCRYRQGYRLPAAASAAVPPSSAKVVASAVESQALGSDDDNDDTLTCKMDMASVQVQP